MLPFTISNHISQSEYIRLVFQLMYQRWAMRLVTIVALISLIVWILSMSGMSPFKDFVFSANGIAPLIFLVIYPLLIWWAARRQYTSSPSISQLVEYTFDDQQIHVKGDDFESKYNWSNITKIRHTKEYLLLYHGRSCADLIRKERLSTNEIEFISAKHKTNQTARRSS